MSRDIPASDWELLSCPNCSQSVEKQPIQEQGDMLVGQDCDADFDDDNTESLNLELNQEKILRHSEIFSINQRIFSKFGESLSRLKLHSSLAGSMSKNCRSTRH